MQISAYIYFECQTFSHDTHVKKLIHFFSKNSARLDGEFGDTGGCPMTQILDFGHR